MGKGLPGWGLREAGLEQEERREDWLSVCVLTEPCGERGQQEGRPSPHRPCPALWPPPHVRALGLPWKAPSYLEASRQHIHRAFPVGLSRRGGPRAEERTEKGECRGVLGPLLSW